MLTKKQFLALYNEANMGIKEIKHSNDRINQSIGVTIESKFHQQSQSEKQVIENLIIKVDKLIDKMQENYLDPQTARKIGSTKQQLRMQKQRRVQLIEAANQTAKQLKQRQRQADGETYHYHNHQNNSKSKKANPNTASIEMQSSDYSTLRKPTQIQNETNQSVNNSQKIQSQITDYDYEIEGQLLHEKNKQFRCAQERVININSIMNSTQKMVVTQGSHLDIIGEELFKAKKNAKETSKQLWEANRTHKKSKKKYICFCCIVVLIVGGALAFAFSIQ